jgi:tetratricopeptide (TPR) repeat protein
MRPDSVRDLYRLGVFEAQIENLHDAVALRAFLRAIAAWRSSSTQERWPQPAQFKPYVRSLYAGARSALRLGRLGEARKLAFACIREDRDTDHVEPLHKLFLAGRVCAAQGQLDHAERAFRLALDAHGPPERGYVFAALADLARRSGRLDEATAWIERHLPAHRRTASQWRLLGDIRRDLGRAEEAMAAYQNALRRDRLGRHLTLVRIGEIHRAAERLDEAERAYDQALTFRQRRHLSEDAAALQGLLAIAERRRDPKRAGKIRESLDRLERKRRRA